MIHKKHNVLIVVNCVTVLDEDRRLIGTDFEHSSELHTLIQRCRRFARLETDIHKLLPSAITAEFTHSQLHSENKESAGVWDNESKRRLHVIGSSRP